MRRPQSSMPAEQFMVSPSHSIRERHGTSVKRASTFACRDWKLPCAGILVAGLLCCPVTALTVRQGGCRLPLLAVPAAPGGEFRFTWMHTVSRRPVSEVFLIDAESRLCLKEMVLDHMGPGLPSHSEDGTVWTLKDGKAIVTGYRRCFDRLHLGVSPLGHHLAVGDSHWDLVARIGPDRLIVVSFERTPLLLIFFSEVLRWSRSPSRS
ncbi:MAG: DUF1850 domain-containing protein [Thermodesulfobacteriota bacterium]